MSRSVLMVDDDEEMCEELSDILSDEGYAVSTAYDGMTGSRMIKKQDYDVILLDMKMPGLEGYEVLKQIKRTKPGTRVIVLTGRPVARRNRLHEGMLLEDDDDKRSEILRLADCVMNKPFDVAKVIEKMAEFTKDRTVG